MHDLPQTLPTDVHLARAWAAGDEQAYEAIVDRYAGMVFSRCRRSLGETDADDATQAVFLVLAQKREQAAASPVLAAWLMTVAGNVVCNARRDRHRRRQAEQSAPPPAPPATESPMQDFQEHLDACLSELLAKEREVVLLHHLAGHTLAEVSQQTGCGLSTVRTRIERGLERLRMLLTKRGVALSGLALTAALASEAQAAVPTAVMDHLHALQPHGSGFAANLVSDRMLRWTRQSTTSMSHIALVSTTLLLLGGAFWQFLVSADFISTSPPPPSPAVDPTWKAVGNPLRDLDPEHARSWIVWRANDCARAVKHFREQPEWILLSAQQKAWFESVDSVGEVSLLKEVEPILPVKKRTQIYRLFQEMALTPLAEREPGAAAMGWWEAYRDLYDKDPESREALNQFLRNNSLPTAFAGFITGNDGETKLLEQLGIFLGDGYLSTTPTGPGTWTYPTLDGPGTITHTGNRISFQAPSNAATPPPLPAPDVETSSSPNPAIEISTILDLGRPGRAPIRTSSGYLEMDDKGFHVSATLLTPLPRPALPDFDRASFARIPTEAIIVIGASLHPTQDGLTGFYRKLFTNICLSAKVRLVNTPFAQEVDSVTTTAGLLLDKADGALLAWLEPGERMPRLTLEMDLGKTDAEAVIAASGLLRAADGSASKMVGPVLITLGWHDGHFVITTHPDGARSFTHRGGFLNHPEIQHALATMPARPLNGCILIQPAAIRDGLGTSMGFSGAEIQQQFSAYLSARTNRPGADYLTWSASGNSTTFEARGALALTFFSLQDGLPHAQAFPLYLGL